MIRGNETLSATFHLSSVVSSFSSLSSSIRSPNTLFIVFEKTCKDKWKSASVDANGWCDHVLRPTHARTKLEIVSKREQTQATCQATYETNGHLPTSQRVACYIDLPHVL
jgi:hypothetical protein